MRWLIIALTSSVVLVASVAACRRPPLGARNPAGTVALPNGDVLDGRLRASFHHLGKDLYAIDVRVPKHLALDVSMCLAPIEIQLVDRHGQKLHPLLDEDPWVMVAEFVHAYPPEDGKNVRYATRVARSFRLNSGLIPGPGDYKLRAVLRVVEMGEDSARSRLRDGGSVAVPHPTPLDLTVTK